MAVKKIKVLFLAQIKFRTPCSFVTVFKFASLTTETDLGQTFQFLLSFVFNNTFVYLFFCMEVKSDRQERL